MLGAELTPGSRRRERRAATRSAALTAQNEQLFLLLATLRGASTDSLYTLHFARQPAPVGLRQAFRTIRALEGQGYLARHALGSSRVIYRLTPRGFDSSERVRRRSSDVARRDPPEPLGHYFWLRSSLWAELTRTGYRVGRGVDEQRALRRFLLDRQSAVVERSTGAARHEAERVLSSLKADGTLTPLFRAVCPKCSSAGPLMQPLGACVKCSAAPVQVPCKERFRCTKCRLISDSPVEHRRARRAHETCDGFMREVDALPFDVAWRPAPRGEDVVIVFVDDPSASLRDQLRAMPLHTLGQPRVPIVLRTTDPVSSYNAHTHTWAATGDRHRELLRAFSANGDPSLFPYSMTSKVIEVRPELQVRIRNARKDGPHESTLE